MNARRAIHLADLPVSSGTTPYFPTGVGVVTGLVGLFIAAVGARRSPSVPVQLILNALLAGGLVAFGITEYRIWLLLAERAPRA